MTNHEKLRDLMIDILLLADGEYHDGLARDDVDTWDSLAVVAVATGIEETFGYHMKEAEAVTIASVADIVNLLEARGVSFAE